MLATNIFYSLFYFLILLGILVFVHEFGHFILAKKLGVGVLKFSLGFGPKLLGKKIGETEYQIAAVPLGGFVKLVGENRVVKVKAGDRARSFSFQPVWKRALIVSAGPLFNVLLGVTFFFFLNPFAIFSTPMVSPHPVIAQMMQNQPAALAGLKNGDIILDVDGVNISTWGELANSIRNSKGKELLIKVKRDEKIFKVKVTPIISKSDGEEAFRIGIKGIDSNLRVGPKFEIGNGFARTLQVMRLIIFAVKSMVQGEITAKDAIGGPIMMAQMAGEQAKKGLADFVFLLAILSIDLAIINLFPIPILDGGHLLFLTLESIIGRPLSIKKLELAQQIGLIFIILLFVFIFYNDIMRILPQGAK